LESGCHVDGGVLDRQLLSEEAAAHGNHAETHAGEQGKDSQHLRVATGLDLDYILEKRLGKEE
jgi:hypothetical protein